MRTEGGDRGWLEDTRASYDTVAVSYADMLRDALAGQPFQRGILALFDELVLLAGFHAGAGSVHKTEGYGGLPTNVHVHRRSSALVAEWLEAAGFTVEAELAHRPAPGVEGGFVFAHR